MSDKSGQAICLTTIEYVVYGSPILTTNCPGCGLRLAIKHDNFVNRVASISLLLGMSLLIGYNLGKNYRWINRLSNKLFGSRHNARRDDNENNKILSCKSANFSTLKEPTTTNDFGLINFSSNNYQPNSTTNFYTTEDRQIEDIDDSKMSDHTCDSAIDVCSSLLDCDLYDEQLLRLLDLSSNDYLSSGEFSNSGAESNKSDDDRRNFRSKTVDRIDQVLHQIDDIKKSIVEIDDEIFQVAGSTYAKFDPNSLILTNGEFDKEFEETFMVSNKSYCCSDSECSSRKLSATSKSINRRETKSSSPQITINDNLIELKSKSDIRVRSSSSDQSDLDSLQLEWDFELGYDDYCNSRPGEVSELEIDDTRSVDLYRHSPAREIPMTDEQKLKNMHNLLDEAKKLGLLNNIIDALNPSSANSIHLKPTTRSSSKERPRPLPTPPASPLRLIEFEDEIDIIKNNHKNHTKN